MNQSKNKVIILANHKGHRQYSEPIKTQSNYYNYIYLLYRHGCFTQKYTTCKIHKNSIRDPSGLFSIISHVSLSMISLISSLSLKLYLNSSVYHRNIFGSSSKIFGNLRQSSEIFGKCSGAFVWPSEQFWKIFGNLRKVVGNLRKIIKNAVISMSI